MLDTSCGSGDCEQEVLQRDDLPRLGYTPPLSRNHKLAMNSVLATVSCESKTAVAVAMGDVLVVLRLVKVLVLADAGAGAAATAT